MPLSDNVIVAGLTTLGLIVVALIGKMSFGSALKASDTANADVVTPDEQDSAAEAIAKSAVYLLAPYEQAVASLTRRVEHTEARLEQAERAAEEAVAETKAARRDAERWRNLARTLARIAVAYRHEIEALDGRPGPEPEEITMLRVMGDLDESIDYDPEKRPEL